MGTASWCQLHDPGLYSKRCSDESPKEAHTEDRALASAYTICVPPMAEVFNSVVRRRRIRLRGIVQGVGFRPFVYNLAQHIGVGGFVLNSSAGLTVEVEGPTTMLDEFAEHLRMDCPPLARIEAINVVDLEPLGEKAQFEIRKSQAGEDKFVLVSPDVASCDRCLSDIADVHNRRFAYPFTNCTNCGPRYTIIRDIPYDRPTTTMAGFRMCADCEAEYHDPRNRRFHAQPNACPACGPTVVLAESGSALPMDADFCWADSTRAFSTVRKLLHEGAIVAVKGLGGFQLACDASNALAVQRLRQRKKRSDKPFALMTRDICDVEKICVLAAGDRELLLSPQRPITILRRRSDANIPLDIAPGNDTVGVMLAYTPLHFLLFADSPDHGSEFPALVMTSGNISDGPIVTSNTG